MRPNTSVRQPVIAGARRQHLSELLRTWRRQPRKRSRPLFWTLLSLALLSDIGILLLSVRLLGVRDAPSPPAERHIYVPYAADAALWEPLRSWVVAVNGRRQLFESFCRKAVRRITGDERFEGLPPLAVVVSWMLDKTNALKWDDYPCLRCEDAALRAVLYRKGHSPSRMSRQEQLHGRYVEPSVVSSSKGFSGILQGVRIKDRAGGDIPLSSLERRALALRDQLKLFEKIRGGGVDAGTREEMQTASAELCQTFQSGDKDLFAAALSDFLEASRRAMRVEEDSRDSRRLACEAWLNKYAPSRKAMYLSLLGAVFFTAAAIARVRRTRWRRGFLLSASLASLGAVGCASAAVLGRAIRDGGLLMSDGRQSMLWSAALVLALSLCLARFGRDAFLGGTGALLSSVGFLAANHWPPLPERIVGGPWAGVQMVLLLSAYAALVLAWAVAFLTLGRILLTWPSGERVRGLAALCVWPVRIAVVLLTAGTLLDGCRALETLDTFPQLRWPWRGWNAQAVGSLLVLPSCAALLYARRRGWIKAFSLLVGVVLGGTLLTMRCYAGAALIGAGWVQAAGLVNLSLAAHAALRYYFGRQRCLEA